MSRPRVLVSTASAGHSNPAAGGRAARRLSGVGLLVAASLGAGVARAESVLYDAGLLSFESKAQSMWGTGDAFRKADSLFVGTEWSDRRGTIGAITGSANALITPAIPSVQISPEIPGYTIPGVPSKLITPAIYTPEIPAQFVNVPPVKSTICAPWPFDDQCSTVTITEGYRKQVSAYVPPKLITPAVYSPAIPPVNVPAVPAVYSPAVPAVYGDTRTGATIDVTSSGKVGLTLGYAIDSGSVDASAGFRATAHVPDRVKATEFFNLNAGSVFATGTLTTQSPKVEAYITPVIQLSGTLDATVCGVALGCASSGKVALPTISADKQRLLSIDPNSLKVLDGVMPDGKPLAEVPIDNQTLTLEGGATLSDPPVVGFKLTGPGGVTIATNLPSGVPAVTAKVATLTTLVPNIATHGSTTNAPVTSTGRSDVLTAKIDLDAVAASQGLIPPTGATLDVLDAGGFKLSVSGDLIDAEAGPVLGVTQSFKFTPVLMSTLVFSRPVHIAGQEGLHERWTGEWNELPALAVDDTTTVSPTFWIDARLTNELGLDLGLVGTYDLLEIGATAKAGPVDVLRFNSLSLNRLLGLGNTMFETDKLAFSVHSESFGLRGFQAIAAVPFTIAVPEPSTYATLLLGLGVLAAASRRRTGRMHA